MQIVRVTKDLEPGTELLFWYKNPVGFHTYGETQQQLKNWGFSCKCALCLARKETTGAALNERKVLWRKLQGFLDDLMTGLTPTGGKLRPANVKKTRKLLQQMETTYSADERAPGAVRLELWVQYVKFGEALSRNGDYSEAIEMIVKGLEAIGFIITACPPHPNSKDTKDRLSSVCSSGAWSRNHLWSLSWPCLKPTRSWPRSCVRSSRSTRRPRIVSLRASRIPFWRRTHSLLNI